MNLCENSFKNNSKLFYLLIWIFITSEKDDYINLQNFLEKKITQIDDFISFTSHFDKIEPILNISQESFMKTFQINFFSQIQLINSIRNLLNKSQKKPSVTFTLESNSLSKNNYYGSYGLSVQLLKKTINSLNVEIKKLIFLG